MLAPLGIALLLAANPYLERGRALYEGLQYKPAEAQLRLALDLPANTTDERREAHDLLARCLLAQGRIAEADQIYSRLLASDPNAPAPRGSPKVIDAYFRAKNMLYPAGFTRLVQDPLQPDTLRFHVVDPWSRIAKITVFAPGGRLEYGADVRGPVPVKPSSKGKPTPVYVEARDAAGELVASLGSKDAPIEIPTATVALVPALPAPPAEAIVAPRPPSKPSPILRAAPVALLALGAVVGAVGGVVYAGPATTDYAAAGSEPIAARRATLDQRAHGEFVVADGLMTGGLAAVAAGVAWLALR